MKFFDLISLLVTVATALFTGFLSSSLLDRVLQQRQKVEIFATALATKRRESMAWLIKLVIKKELHEGKPIICYTGKPGNKISKVQIVGKSCLESRITLMENGRLECDVSFMSANTTIEILCHMLERDIPRFHGVQKSLKIGLSQALQRVTLAQRAVLVAKLRYMWVLGNFLILGVIALMRLIYLAISSNLPS